MYYGETFSYQGFNFKPINKFNKKIDALKVFKLLKKCDLEINLTKYSYDEFYDKYKYMNKEILKKDMADVFICLESSRLYIPGNDGLYLIKRLDKIKRMLIGDK